MSANLLEGNVVAAAVLEDVARRVAILKQKGIQPGLGTILVGEDGPSVSYVNKKHETCKTVDIASFHIAIPATATQAAICWQRFAISMRVRPWMPISSSIPCPKVLILTKP